MYQLKEYTQTNSLNQWQHFRPQFDSKKAIKQQTDKPLAIKPNLDGIPSELKTLTQWVCWRWVKKEGEWNKVPISPRTLGNASTVDPDTWTSLKASWLAYEEEANNLDGIGFVFREGDDLTGIDFDECRYTDGSEDKEAKAWIDGLQTYTELSPTCGGYHSLCYVPPELLAKHNNKHGRYEAYNSKRFFCITGQGNGLPISRADEPFTKFAKSCLGERVEKVSSKASNPPKSTQVASKPHEAINGAEMRYRLHTVKQDAKFKTLYQGNWQEEEADHSKAVQSFLWKVAFYFGDDFDTGDKLFRESSLWCGKWSEGKWERLGESEWNLAVNGCEERYTLPSDWQIRLASMEGLPVKTIIDELEPGLPSTNKTTTQPTRRRGYRLTDFQSMPAPKWLVKNHLSCQSFSVVYGVSGSGKTFYSLDMGLSVASGLPFLGVYPVEQKPVLYLTGEGNASIQHRIKAWLKAHNLTHADYPNDCVFVPFVFDMLNQSELQPIEEIINCDLGKQPGLIIVDTLARYFGVGDENKTQDMNRFIGNLDKLREKTQASVCVVHHAGWDDSRERGASALRGAADTIIGISKANNILVQCTKQKDAEPFTEYLLKPLSHDVGYNEEGDDITSLTLALTDEQEKKYLLLPRAKKDALLNLWIKHNANPFIFEQAKDTLGKSRGQTSKDLQELHRRFDMLTVSTKEDGSNVYHIKPEVYNPLKKECHKLFPF